MGQIPPSIVNAPIVYYAVGGGMGHVTRAAAILRQLRRLGVAEATVLTNTTFPHPLRHEAIPYRHLASHTPEALASEVRYHLADLTPRAVIVDVFADGIVGELLPILPDLTCRKVLVTRHVRAAYQQRQATAAAYYDAVISTEDAVPWSHARQIPCEPILIRSAGELFSRDAARQHLGVEDDAPIVLTVSTGSMEWEQDFLELIGKIWRRREPRAHVRVASPRASAHAGHVAHYPLFELFAGVDVVIGAGGYNLYHEVRASGTTGIFLPQYRRIDDQEWRTHAARVAQTPEELDALLEHALHAAASQPKREPFFRNGAESAAQAIVNLLGESECR